MWFPLSLILDIFVTPLLSSPSAPLPFSHFQPLVSGSVFQSISLGGSGGRWTRWWSMLNQWEFKRLWGEIGIGPPVIESFEGMGDRVSRNRAGFEIVRCRSPALYMMGSRLRPRWSPHMTTLSLMRHRVVIRIPSLSRGGQTQEGDGIEK